MKHLSIIAVFLICRSNGLIKKDSVEPVTIHTEPDPVTSSDRFTPATVHTHITPSILTTTVECFECKSFAFLNCNVGSCKGHSCTNKTENGMLVKTCSQEIIEKDTNHQCSSHDYCNGNVPALMNPINCYECDSTNGKCEKTCRGGACFTADVSMNGKKAILKGCVEEKFAGFNIDESSVPGVTGTVKSCDTDLCNGSTSLKFMTSTALFVIFTFVSRVGMVC